MTSNLGPQCVFAAGDTFLTNTPRSRATGLASRLEPARERRYSTRRSCAGGIAGGEGETTSAPFAVW